MVSGALPALTESREAGYEPGSAWVSPLPLSIAYPHFLSSDFVYILK